MILSECAVIPNKLLKKRYKEVLRIADFLVLNGTVVQLFPFVADAVIQVLIFGVARRLIGYVSLIHACNGFGSLLTCKVIVEIAMDMRIFRQLHERLF